MQNVACSITKSVTDAVTSSVKLTSARPAFLWEAGRKEVVGESRWLLVVEGIGTEHARLAQGGFLGQFYKRNPFKRNF